MLQNVPLAAYSTMRLGGNAAYLTEVITKADVGPAVEWALSQKLPVIMIGIGSNIIWGDSGFPGLVIINKITGFEPFNEDAENIYINVGAGENWDSVVKRTVDLGYSGLEQLSLIPGTAGATPVQNVGAYGREIADALVLVEAYDSKNKLIVNIPSWDCGFSYRNSRFKGADKGRFFITGISLHLTRQNPLPPFYESLQGYFSQMGITKFTPQIIRDAVIAIRSEKLPDPNLVANNGSFFANPIIDAVTLGEIRDQYPDIKYWGMPDGTYKLAAGWLLDKAGFKDYHDQETGMATWKNQALVFVNEHAQSTADLLKFRQKVTDKIEAMFGIALVQEPELIN